MFSEPHLSNTPPDDYRSRAKKRRKPNASDGSTPSDKQDKQDKRYICTWENCGKSFSRIDHLNRHRLNHEPNEIFSCSKCPKSFVRQDLLGRHLERHEKRELKTGKTEEALFLTEATTTMGGPVEGPPHIGGQNMEPSFELPLLDRYLSFNPATESTEYQDFFQQSSYGAPFVSALQYDWLFSGDNLDWSWGVSRPASPGHDSPDRLLNGVGIPGTGMVYNGVGNGNGLGDFNMGAGAASMLPNGMGALNHMSLETIIDSSPSSNSVDEAKDPSCFVPNRTRLKLLKYLGPEWAGLESDSRWTIECLTEYLTLFWKYIHDIQAPVIHRPTFKASHAPAPLILSMIMIGCFFSPTPGAHQLSTKLHPVIRGNLICSPDFRPKNENWIHQALLFLIIYGKMMSNRIAHEMSHIFWSSVVTLSRRSGLFSHREVTVPKEKEEDLTAQWHAWVEEESARRVAQVGFSIDVLHAAMFRHSPTISAFQLQLTLPCKEEEWEASSPEAWKSIHNQQDGHIQFISALKASMISLVPSSPGSNRSNNSEKHKIDVDNISAFGRIVLLNGLVSVAQDLGWRDYALGFHNGDSKIQGWRDMVGAAYNSWKSKLDQVLISSSGSSATLLRASISLYALSHITLSIDTHELQIFAGSSTAAGLVVSPAMSETTRLRVKQWAANKDGRAASWHASHFIRSTLTHDLSEAEPKLSESMYHNWAIYVSCLTVYAYGEMSSKNEPRSEVGEDYQTHSMKYLDRICTNSPEELVNIRQKNDSLGLIKMVVEYIRDPRWEIMNESVRLLSRLVEPALPS